MADTAASATTAASVHDVQIGRLRLRGPQDALAPAQAAGRAGLAAAWGQAAWPIVDDDEVLLLRRLRVRVTASPAAGLPAAALAQATAAATRALAARAADPWAPGAAQAEALRFASRADYVAWRLLGVLGLHAEAARATTTGPGGAHPADAVGALLGEAAPTLPAVWRRLREAGGAPALQRLWAALTAPAAEALLTMVAAANGWLPALRGMPAALGATATPGMKTPSPPTVQAAMQAVGPAPVPADLALLPNPASLWARLGAPGQPAHDARTRLAALLAWWLHAPARLQAADAAQALHTAALRLAPPAPRAHPGPGAASPRPRDPGAHRSPSAPPAEATPAAPAPTADSPDDLPSDVTAPGSATDVALEARAESRVTGHGNLFWLFPVLGLPAFQQRLAHLAEPQAGWREWVRLVQALGAEPDAAWWAFVAGRTAEPDLDALRALHWPTPLATSLLDAARQRYGAAALQAALAPCPARVVADEVRVDVHFRLADARLDVRRVGLDADPGWQPWLGCVLRWHYGSALAPQGDVLR